MRSYALPFGEGGPGGAGRGAVLRCVFCDVSANSYCAPASSAPAASPWGTFPKGEGYDSIAYNLYKTCCVILCKML